MAGRAAASRCSQAALTMAAGHRNFVTSTAVKMKTYFSPSPGFSHEPQGRSRVLKPEFTPVYVALGLIGLSASLGIYTATHELEYAPNVLLRKKRRETVPEVDDPEWAATEAELFVDHSLFRRLAHLQDYPHPSFPRTTTMKDLRSDGVDPHHH